MQTKQTIAIIGATGNMGAAIAKNLARGNYRLLIMGGDQQKLEALTAEINKKFPASEAEFFTCSHAAGWEADVIVLTVPYAAEREVAEKIKDVAKQKIVVSISNPLNETFDGLVTSPESSAAEELQKLLPHSKIVKAFNTTFASGFAQPVIDGIKSDAFIAGDDEDALEMVSEMVTVAGFNPMIAGDLTVSRTLEQMQLLLIRMGIRNNYNWQAGWKILHN